MSGMRGTAADEFHQHMLINAWDISKCSKQGPECPDRTVRFAVRPAQERYSGLII